jgi:antibiotic biosynthesis monooxygenase (ABM) superfamily enzyme
VVRLLPNLVLKKDNNMQKIPKWKTPLMIWLGIYPTITIALFLLSPLLNKLALPIKTLCLTLIVVPVMVWIVLPLLQKALKNWLFSN